MMDLVRRALMFGLAIGVWFLGPDNARANEQCFDIGNGLPSLLAGRSWSGFQLRRSDEVDFLLFLEQPNKPTTQALWVIASAVPNKVGQFCVEAQGKEVTPLQSLHASSFQERFGLPGTGLPRCATKSDALGSVKVRAWASRELGDSIIFSLDGSDDNTFVLLLARLDAQWILLQDAPSHGTCYRDRGKIFDVRVVNASR